MVASGRGPPLKTDPQALLRLLDVQQADLELARIIARRDALPEAAQAKQAVAAAASARDQAVLRRTEASDLQREVRKLEDEVERVRQRAKRDAELLQGGTISNVRQLTELQHEISSLSRRQNDLEEAELELMEQSEAASAAQVDAEKSRDDLASAAEQAQAQAKNAMQELGERYRATKAQRAELAESIPADLLALYDKLRVDHGGLGAAEFAQDLCGGCQLQMPPSDLSVVKAAPVDEVVRCEECRRILVRTSILRL